MFAIAFDLVVADVQKHHPKGVAQASIDIKATLGNHGFDWIQGSLYVGQTEDLTKLFSAVDPLRDLVWRPPSVRDVRAFRVEHWSDFTALVEA